MTHSHKLIHVCILFCSYGIVHMVGSGLMHVCILFCSYGSTQVRYAVCSIVLQRVMSMASIAKDDQRRAYAYAVEKMNSASGCTA